MSVVAPERAVPTALCSSCEHPAEWHQHLRRGTDCSGCECGRVSVRRQRVLPVFLSVASTLVAAARARTWVEH